MNGDNSVRPGDRILVLAYIIAFCVAWAPLVATARATVLGAELGLSDAFPNTQVLVLPSDSDSSSDFEGEDTGSRMGCSDEGFSTYPYAVSDPPTASYIWLSANTMYGDDLTLEPGVWRIGCYDVFIFADNDPSYNCNRNRTVTLRAHDSCNGTVIPGSQEQWTVPPQGGPILLTAVTNIDFITSGTIWFSLTTTIHDCDGWYAGQTNLAGSTTINVQAGSDCTEFIEGVYNKFHVVLYGSPCAAPFITDPPDGALVCDGQSHEFCVAATGEGVLEYQWWFDDGSGWDDIAGAEADCHTASLPGLYRCVVTNDCGSTTSDVATLAVTTEPTMTGQPVGGIVCVGRPLDLCVGAEGVGVIHYLWKRNGMSLIGANSSCYTAEVPGSYKCIITDDCGIVESDTVAVALPGGIDVGTFVDVQLGIDVTPQNVAAADMDCDGSVDGSDIQTYVNHILSTG